MHLRLATLQDVPRISEIAAAAFKGSELHDFLFPGWEKHWDDVVTYWYQSTREYVLEPNTAVIVVETETKYVPAGMDPNKPIVVAYAVWQLYTNAPVELFLAKSTICDVMRRYLAKLQCYSWSLVHEDKAADHGNWNVYFRSIGAVFNKEFSGPYSNHWHCWRLATDPDWERKGAGSMLTKWGLNKAEAMKMSAGLESSEKGIDMYLPCGFERLAPVDAELPMTFVMRKSYM